MVNGVMLGGGWRCMALVAWGIPWHQLDGENDSYDLVSGGLI